MPEDLLKKNQYAANIESLLIQEAKIDLNAISFDYKSLMTEFIQPESIKTRPIDDTGMDRSIHRDTIVLADLTQAEEKAAVSGKFDPYELLSSKTPAERKNLVLSFLAVNCLIDTVKDVKWQLNGKKRREVLTRMIEEGSLSSCLDSKLPVTDIFGVMLRWVLKEQQDIAVDSLSQAELVALTNVLETLEGVNIPKPVINSVRSRIQDEGALGEYAAITVGFVGREKEQKTLSNFVQGAVKEKGRPSAWAGMVVTGYGGVGKSTLLAKFAHEVIEKKAAVVAILDFDRPGINATDIFWLTQEVCRQITEQHPEIRERFSLERNRVNEVKKRYVFEKGAISDFDQSWTPALLLSSWLKTTLIDSLQVRTPVLLILDTVEEVVQNNETDKLQDWISKLSDAFLPMAVRVIFSGRLYDGQVKSLLKHSLVVNKPLTVDEFDAPIASRFLVQQGLTSRMASEIVNAKLFPLRPLELKLLARLLKEGKGRFSSLAKELQTDKRQKVNTELFTGLIYRRVLMRIQDKRVREIAYPGLILRYVTAELIMRILKPTLGLTDITEDDAKDIIEKLGRLNWLAYIQKDQVWHRKDLRRSMLRLMLTKDPAITSSIRKAAIDYFGSQPSPVYQAECIYHQLMQLQKREDGMSLDLSRLRKAYSHLSRDLNDLPGPAAALLQYAAGQPLHDRDLYLLPKAYFKDLYHQTGKHLLSERKMSEAYRLYLHGKRMHIPPLLAKQDELLDNWEMETLFCMADWQEIKDRGQILSRSEETSLVSVLNYVFPLALVEPRRIDWKMMYGNYYKAMHNKALFGAVTMKVNQITVLSRLSVCLTIFYANKKLSTPTRSLEFFKKTAIKDATPVMIKSFVLLDLMETRRTEQVYAPGVSLLCLDPQWLSGLQSLLSPSHKRLLYHTVRLFERPPDMELTARQFLNQLDGDGDMRKQWREISIELKGMKRNRMYELLRGPDPIFRDPCRYAILDAFKTKRDIEALAGIMRKVIPLPVLDLRTGVLQVMLEDNRELAFEPLIELIDRSWSLGKFLSLACKAKPKALKLRNVHASYKRYQTALKTLILHTE